MGVLPAQRGDYLNATRGAKLSEFWRWPAQAARTLVKNLGEERDRWILWTPVAFGCGIAIYFSLKFEPAPWLGLSLGGVAALLLAV